MAVSSFSALAGAVLGVLLGVAVTVAADLSIMPCLGSVILASFLGAVVPLWALLVQSAES